MYSYRPGKDVSPLSKLCFTHIRIQDNYVDPETFDGLRFEKMRGKDTEGEPQSKHSLVSLDFDYLLFGHGRHAWYAYQLL